MVRGLTVTIYDNQGKPVHPALPFFDVRPERHFKVNLGKIEKDGNEIVVPLFIDFLDTPYEGLSSSEFLLIGEFYPALKSFDRLEILLTSPVSKKTAAAVAECKKMRTEDWGDEKRIVFALDRSGARFMARGAECAVAAWMRTERSRRDSSGHHVGHRKNNADAGTNSSPSGRFPRRILRTGRKGRGDIRPVAPEGGGANNDLGQKTVGSKDCDSFWRSACPAISGGGWGLRIAP
jgi:hypothetical protein